MRKAVLHIKQLCLDLLKLIGIWLLVGGGAALVLWVVRWVLSLSDGF